MAPHRDAPSDPLTLRRSIERALHRDDPPDEVLPMLERLRSVVQEDSDDRNYADRRLAEMLLETEPFRAAVLLRRLIVVRADDDANWALMGLAQALLGNHRFAASAYRRALAIDPGNPWYSHNLGHLLDVALDRPHEALPHLERSARRMKDVPAIACSLAHARWRSGDVAGARKALRPLLARGHGNDPDVSALSAALDRPPPARRKRHDS
jgi:Flp pilus assembly protein TadD